MSVTDACQNQLELAGPPLREAADLPGREKTAYRRRTASTALLMARGDNAVFLLYFVRLYTPVLVRNVGGQEKGILG